MSKRSKKKNPSALTAKDRENIEFNAALDRQKAVWVKKFNITLAVVMSVVFVCILLLPVFSMSFTRSLKDLIGDAAGELDESADEDFTMVTSMSFLDFLTALAGGYEDSVSYIAANNNSGIDSSVVDTVFRNFVSQDEVEELNRAYYVAFALAIALLAVYIINIARSFSLFYYLHSYSIRIQKQGKGLCYTCDFLCAVECVERSAVDILRYRGRGRRG